MAVAQVAAVVAPVMVASAAAAPSVCLPSPCQSSRRALLSRAPIGACRLRWRRRRTLARSARRRGRTSRGLVIVNEFGGSYEEGFEDVQAQIVDYFTYKATNTVLHQLYEMNPPAYTWLYNYVVVNDPKEGKHFLRALAKIACGRRLAVIKEDHDKINLVQWAWDLYGRNEIINAIDERLDGAFEEREVVCLMDVGLWCAHPDYNLRPSIRQAISVLY